MKKIILITLVLFSTATSFAAESSPAKSPDLKKQISDIQKKAGLPGLQVTVYKGNELTFGYADGVRALGQSEKVTAQDVWHWGSITKPMTALLIGQLIDEGKVSLQTKIKEVVPKKYKVHASVENITVVQLLAHRSGLVDVSEPLGGRLWMSAFKPFSETSRIREALVKGVLESPVKFEPGTEFQYVNSGYIVLGWMIEQIRGESWEKVITKNLFDKLEMKSCGFGPAGQENKKTAIQPWGHSFENNEIKALPPNEKADNPYALGPAGTVHCSVSDLNKFMKVFFKDEKYRNKVISSKTLEDLLINPYSAEETLMTLAGVDRGWAKGRGFFMTGSNTFNYAVVAFSPVTGRSYFINTNIGRNIEEPATEILGLILTSK